VTAPEVLRDEGPAAPRTAGPAFGALLRSALAGTATGPSLGVVVVNYCSHTLLEQNLPAGLAAAGVRVVVVDNFSGDAERRALRALAAKRDWTLVEQENVGFGDGVNAGVLRGAQLGCRVFIALNPDAVADPATLVALGRAAATEPMALVSPEVVRSDGGPFFRGSLVSMRTGRVRTGWVPGDGDPEWKNWLSGACVAFSGSAFAELNGFAPGYFLYWEDVDLSRRASAMGAELVIRRDLTVVHDEGGTHNLPASRPKSPLYYYYNTRNRLLFGARHARPEDRRAWLLATPGESLQIWLRGGRRQLLTRPGGLWAAVRGTFAGVRLFARRTVAD
jgi:GT2 family glycosyltransferase